MGKSRKKCIKDKFVQVIWRGKLLNAECNANLVSENLRVIVITRNYLCNSTYIHVHMNIHIILLDL